MKSFSSSNAVQSLFVLIIALALATTVFAQGRGRGGGVGGGHGSGGGMGGPPPGAGVDRGLGNASERSGGRSDNGMATASERSNGRSSAGLDRARMARDNMRRADEDLRDHPGIPNIVHTNANSLRAGYRAALASNPNLKFGEYVAATRLGQNLGSRFPNVTRDAILSGLASGDSIGRTLQNLGVNDRVAKDAKKQVEREIKDARRNH